MLEQESGPGGELERRQHVMAVAVDEAGAVRAEEGVNGMIAGAIWEQPKIVKVVKIGAGQKEEDEEEEKKERETEKEAEREKFLMGLFPQGANKEFYGAIIKVLKEKKEELLGKDSDSEWWCEFFVFFWVLPFLTIMKSLPLEFLVLSINSRL